MSKPVAWLLSAYRTDSHAYWSDWLQTNITTVDWKVIELPGRHFRWRIRGNPLSWLDSLPLEPPRFILATSMVDLATLKGIKPQLASVPGIYYFHENQFAYPEGEHQVRSIEPQMVQLYGALAADACLFNSSYNMESFLEGVDGLLKKMPDHVPNKVSTRLREKSSLLPVAIEPIPAGHKQALILWNHRWEYDKDPNTFANAILELDKRNVDFKLALLGARHQKPADALLRLREHCSDRIQFDGRVDDESYRHILGQARIVVSTALHEFQGISVMQAVSAGAEPVVPDNLCYPEQYEAQYRYPAGDTLALAAHMESALKRENTRKPLIKRWFSDELQPQWSAFLNQYL